VIALSSSAPHVKAGKMRLLAVTTARRASAAPQVPTVAESGVPDFDASLWVGLFAPAGVARPVVDKLNSEVNRILKEPDVRERLGGLGAEPVGSTPEELAARIKADAARYARIAREAGIRLD
jgi:tripartite-type tricarboxylate transporter receptor subunit TctC